MNRPVLFISSLAWLAAGCGGEPAVSAVSRDSAGITIVEIDLRGDEDGGLPRWSFSLPLVEVGGLEDEPGHQLREVIGAARLSDGSLLIDYYELGHGNNVEAWAAQGTEPTFRAEGWLVRVHADGARDSLRPVRGVEWFKRGKWRQDLWLAPRPFAPQLAAVVAGPRVFVGEGASGEIEVRTSEGSLERLIRWSAAPVPVTAGDRARVEEDALAGLRQPARRDDLRRWLAEVPFPDSKPAFAALATDAAERLWVQLPAPAGEAVDRWVVFTAGGNPIALASPPAGSRLLEIGDDYAIALWRDALDVEHVRLHGLEKG